MGIYTFTLVLDRPPTDDELDRLFEAGCDDAAFGTEHVDGHGLVPIAEFDRDATTRDEAVASATLAVESVGIGVVRVVTE